jgi:NADPH:quinone reductase
VRAVLCQAFGPPESLVVGAVEEPRPGPDQVVVAVGACSVSFPDVLMIQGLYQFKPALPFSPGGEVAGVVSAVGDDVRGVAVGDRVFASTGWGGLAEKVAVPAGSTVPIPDGIDVVPASGFLYAYGTSYHALKDRAALRAGETLLVLGAAGGVGLAAVELGAAMGATVIAAASTEAKLAVCRDHGAAMTINYEEEDLKARTRELTDGRGADVVYDAVGGRFSEQALRATAWNGRFLVIGFAAGDIPKIPLNLPLLKGCSIVGVFWGSFMQQEPERARANTQELVALWREGRLRPHVSATYPLERAGEAIRHLADRRAEGKVIVTVTPAG